MPINTAIANESFLQACLGIAVPSAEERLGLMKRVRETHERGSAQAGGCEPEAQFKLPNLQEMVDGGRFLADPDGQRRFIGNASGAAFLDQLREFASTVLPLVCRGDNSLRPSQIQDSFSNLLGRYQTHDSRPLQLPLVDPYYLPPVEEAERLLSTLSLPTSGASNASFFYWGPLPDIMRQVYSGDTLKDIYAHSIQLATLNAAMALATQQSPTLPSELQTGESYFARAYILLGRPLDTATRTHVPCLSMIGYYLLGANRRDAAYSYIRLAGHIAVTYGYYQSWMTSEAEKREFWTVYVLERFVSCLLGRPPMILDGNISVDLPTDTPDLPNPEGLRLHVKLAKIIGCAVEKIYGYGGRGSKNPGLAHIYHFLDELDNWRSEVPPSFDIDGCLMSEAARDITSLHMAYNQARILVTRQILFSAVRQNVARSFVPSLAKFQPADQHLVKICRTAAYENVQLLHRLFETVNSGDSTLGIIDYHNAFNAAIILELDHLRRPANSPYENTEQLGRILNILHGAGQNGNEFARDCSTVLADLRQLGGKLTQEMSRQNQTTTLPLKTQTVQGSGNLPPGIFDVPDVPPMSPAPIDSHPEFNLESVLEEFTNWLEAGPF
ncbi:hypothetical protein N7510_001622 [Penicillium lagena]|uniref:uncharacterized protein n=1 Tax=Penicillium lagena TaxID=94218 RepID=UPI0025417F8A|nr:uncharacterized protein N7510_001622 [Penicillium lagena]KAJ5625313.1 hypothetical protein N7510_001622 [Penicillium lagena]